MQHKLILLPPGHVDSVQSNLSSDDRDYLHEVGANLCTHQLALDYSVWSAQQIVRAILPNDIDEVTTSFETIGHIAHVNLRESQLDYKHVIGQVLLDKNKPRIRTIVNKTSDIQETFRFFKMELLAGSDDMIATVIENGCSFTFDFSQVYWNSRLHTEHRRVVNCLSSCDVVCDVFAGVGPFVVPAAKKGCHVYANDLNPTAYRALCENSMINHVENRIRTYNLDGRDFIKKLVEEITASQMLGKSATAGCDFQNSSISPMFSHVVMNLPAMAAQFLDVFKGLFKDLTNVRLPTIYCYCFSKAADPEEDAKHQCEHIMGIQIDSEVHRVRDVAPNKVMLCVSFQLPPEIAYDKSGYEQNSDTKGDLY